jgi:uncharacterized protein
MLEEAGVQISMDGRGRALDNLHHHPHHGVLPEEESTPMLRDMRRQKQLLSKEATEEILDRGLSGVLAVSGDDGYPYAVPLSYVYHDNKIYFHSANTGHKLDGIQRNPKVSFCVIDKDQIVPEKRTTYFRSAIVFGQAGVVTDDATKHHALELLVQKYSADYQADGAAEISQQWKAVTVVEILVEHMTGKEAKELVNIRGLPG